MDAERIVELLNRLRCDRIRVRARWVTASCPLAAWTHSKSHTDASPSFGVRIDPEGESRWQCYACGRRGLLSELVWLLKRFDAKTHTDALAFVRYADDKGRTRQAAVKARVNALVEASTESPTTGWYVRAKPTKSVEVLEPLPEEDLERYFLPITEDSEAGQYLRNRRLPTPAWAQWELRWQPESRRVAIPIRDRAGRLMGITGRAIDSTVKKRWLHSTGFRRDYILFGENHIRPPMRTAIVVEGNFDTIYLWALGYAGTVGVMGSYISSHQLQLFRQFFDNAVIFRDGDAPGKEAAERWYTALSTVMPTKKVPVQEGRDPDEYTKEELLDILGPPSSGQL